DGPLRGRLVLNNCQFSPRVKKSSAPIYTLDSELGTSLTNCIIHPPRVDGQLAPEMFDQIEFVQINKKVRYSQLNTSLSNHLLAYLKEQNIALLPTFIAMLKCHHHLEPETIS